METHHAVAGLEFGDAMADGNNCAGQFMAEDLWRLHVALVNFLNVGAANAAGCDFDKNFAFADFGNWDFFNTNNSLFAVNASAHGFGDGAESALRLRNRTRTDHDLHTFAELLI